MADLSLSHCAQQASEGAALGLTWQQQQAISCATPNPMRHKIRG
eukprot:CAMPEP_0202065888 /NCGR_PEP_ID=MMETSP0963-20130614/52627_1 /ASSEMBLY_ACC=CAM_ASM_000494 /TAXON_ID=4773 /ORGANISM="Schizochytrium aggregatum, Strain ATCC28209" /LENGTH=43 /DNA_ID= /DNA_START= /DNA_END= /DNA_ORIENTATION=